MPIYGDICSCLSVGVHFMSIYGDHCRYSSGSILCPYMEISVYLRPFYAADSVPSDRNRFDHLFACVHLCPYMEISVSVCLRPLYAHIWRSLTICLPVTIYAHICRYLYLSACVHLCPYGDLCRHSAGSGKH